MARASEVIRACLTTHLHHNEPRIANWYHQEMEVQIMVSQGRGEPVSGKTGVYTNDETLYDWYNFRIPRNANTDPIDNDHELKYPLEHHVEAIGMTGWNWKQRKSVRVGFDFDAITGHAQGVGISDDQLEEIREKLLHVPEALVLKSTGGLGLHLYLEFDPENLPDTQNHTEHAALALACLRYLSQQVGFDFQAGLDVGGGNMWIWHRKMTAENKGLTILKDNGKPDGSTAYLTIPENWRLYIDVASRKRQKVRIEGVPDDEQGTLSNKAAAQKNIPLDDTHKRIISDLQSFFPEYSTVWSIDHHLLQTHTYALKAYADRRDTSGDPVKGLFETLSEGKNPTNPNCFCFPLEGGGFRVVRFGKGTKEHETWKMDKGGWTYTYFNQPVNFFHAATAYSGVEDDKSGFTFTDSQSAVNALRAMGHLIAIPDEIASRKVLLKPHKGGKLLVEIESFKEDKDLDIVGWIKKRGKWIKIYNISVLSDADLSVDFEEIDANIRAVITTSNTLSGWFIRHEQGMWMQLTKDDSRSKLKALGYMDEVEPMLGHILSKSWIHVSIPFREEYPGNRQWNVNAAQLRFDPASNMESIDGESLHPNWDLIFKHIGRELDEYLVELPWAQRNHMQTGQAYLMTWVACMIREPFEPLPYLYLYGPQNSGKSIFHEALSLLMTRGVMRADTALTNPSDFNGELAGAILCVVEEKNIAKHGAAAYNKIKDWVTSPMISIHAKYKQVFQQRNSTHWIQCANDKMSCPVFPGDTRITMIHVPELIPGSEVPKAILLSKLEEEAPYFLATLLTTPLPDLEERLRLPIVATSNKDQLEEANKTPLEEFLTDRCYPIDGLATPFTDFYAAFYATLTTSDEKSTWTKQRVCRELPIEFPVGYYLNKIKYIGNLALEPAAPMTFTLVSKDNRLIKRSESNGQ
jgi:hypothetical protein